MEGVQSSIIPLVAVTLGLGLVTFIVITTTAFVKVSVVLFLVRNALGIQQTPPNVALYGIALSLTFYVSAPVVSQIQQKLDDPTIQYETASDIMAAVNIAKGPVQNFLQRLTTEEDREFFVAATDRIWDENIPREVSADDFTIL
ncbi:MAG: EscR/YscR/HrcR family type III secretion system export apparatus protein, partial [Pseudomonadota bacterium]